MGKRLIANDWSTQPLFWRQCNGIYLVQDTCERGHFTSSLLFILHPPKKASPPTHLQVRLLPLCWGGASAVTCASQCGYNYRVAKWLWMVSSGFCCVFFSLLWESRPGILARGLFGDRPATVTLVSQVSVSCPTTMNLPAKPAQEVDDDGQEALNAQADG